MKPQPPGQRVTWAPAEAERLAAQEAQPLVVAGLKQLAGELPVVAARRAVTAHAEVRGAQPVQHLRAAVVAAPEWPALASWERETVEPPQLVSAVKAA
jgi:hypothetical protein